MTIRVLVADDQSMVRAGFRLLLGSQDDIEVVAEASDGREAVEKTARFTRALLFEDVIPGVGGSMVAPLFDPRRGKR